MARFFLLSGVTLALATASVLTPSSNAIAKPGRVSPCAGYASQLCPGLKGQPGAQRACLKKVIDKVSPECRARVEEGSGRL